MGKKGFMDGYKTYDTSEGFGSSWEWKRSFYITERKTHPSFLRGWDVSDKG